MQVGKSVKAMLIKPNLTMLVEFFYKIAKKKKLKKLIPIIVHHQVIKLLSFLSFPRVLKKKGGGGGLRTGEAMRLIF